MQQLLIWVKYLKINKRAPRLNGWALFINKKTNYQICLFIILYIKKKTQSPRTTSAGFLGFFSYKKDVIYIFIKGRKSL